MAIIPEENKGKKREVDNRDEQAKMFEPQGKPFAVVNTNPVMPQTYPNPYNLSPSLRKDAVTTPGYDDIESRYKQKELDRLKKVGRVNVGGVEMDVIMPKVNSKFSTTPGNQMQDDQKPRKMVIGGVAQDMGSRVFQGGPGSGIKGHTTNHPDEREEREKTRDFTEGEYVHHPKHGKVKYAGWRMAGGVTERSQPMAEIHLPNGHVTEVPYKELNPSKK